MKKLFAIISVLGIFAACNTQEIIEQDGQDCLVTINLVGEITTSEESLTKSVPSTNDLYVVQVYNGSNPFACGVFDDMSLCKLNLKKGSSYSVHICMVRDAKTYLGEDFSLTNNGIRSYYTSRDGSRRYDSDYSGSANYYRNENLGPYYFGGATGFDEEKSSKYYYFYRTNCRWYNSNRYVEYYNGTYYYQNENLGPYFFGGANGYDNGKSSNYFYRTNCLWYNSNRYVEYYDGSTTTATSRDNYPDYKFQFSQIRSGKLLNSFYPTCTDWFYGEVNNYTPNGETATMDIVLRRTGFGLKYELSGVTDGEVTVKVYNGTRTFIENTTNISSYESEEQFIAFYDTYSAWQYADNYTENMTVAVTWKRSIGVTQDLGTKTIQVKRNCLNNIKITLGSDDKNAGLSLTTEEESSMGSTSSTIPVE